LNGRCHILVTFDHPACVRRPEGQIRPFRTHLRQCDARKSHGYKNHIGIDKAHGLIRTWDASAANAHDGARLPDLVSKANTGSGVWADTAYRSKKNEAFLAAGMFKSHIHQKRKPRQPLPDRIARANTRRSKIRAQVEHVFAGQKHRMGLVVRTIGIARATIKIGMANLVYNFQRLAWLEGRAASA